MSLQFSCINNAPEQFFNLLPQDWQNSIVPKWETYKNEASIYVLKKENNIVSGGIVFSTIHPQMTDFEMSFKNLYTEGYLYIGFIWVIPSKRNQNLATEWLSQLKKMNSTQKYWLTIEEESLSYFYIKNGFKLIQESNLTDSKEWLLTYEPSPIPNL